MDENDHLSELNKILLGHNRTKNSFSINHFPEFHHIETLKFTNISSS